VDDHADVVIVGAGAAGGVVARRLAEAGLGVVVLEQGNWPDRESFRGASADWELNGRKQWSAVPGIREDPADYPVDLEASAMGVVNYNGVGGGTVLYQGAWLRLFPSDFRARSLDGVGDDWPVTYDELRPFYDEVDRQFGVSGLGGDPAYPPADDPPLPPLPVGEAGLRVARAQDRLGWHWWPHPCSIASVPYEGRHPCVRRGTCAQGCNEGAKASTDLTHFPPFLAAGGRLVTGARVRRIIVGEDRLAQGVEWVDPGGAEHFQAADVVVCAANGIGTPRLLLLSADSRFPDGLANSSGLVGRRLMMHPHQRAIGLFDDSLGTWQGQNGAYLVCLEFHETDTRRGFVRGAKWTLAPTGGPLGLALGADVWGAGHHGHLAERLGRTVGWNVMVEDLPDEANRVELSERSVDSSGLAAPRLVYRVDDNAERILAWNVARATESLIEAGARRVEYTRAPLNGHFMGTARMGDDPTTSVVDRWGLAHDVPNLAVVDGSLFVTAGSTNPTATICALALRTAQHLVERRRDLPRPRRRSRPVAPGYAKDDRPPAPPRPRPRPLDLAPDERARLGRLADALIPGDERMPPAGAVVARLLDAVMAARPDLVGQLHDLLAVGFSSAPDRLADLRHRPTAWAALVTTVAGAYYLAPEVHTALGYPGLVALPVVVEFPQYVAEGLLERVGAPGSHH
jgi:choline dehydrogenase-like flavoprotein